MKKFQRIHCGRSVDEQRCIHAKCAVYDRLPEEERSGIRALVAEIDNGDAEAGRALMEVLTEGKTPEQAAASRNVPAGRLYAMQREFYRRMWL